MKNPAKLTAGLAIAVALFFAGYLANRHPAARGSSASQVASYTCPMHPQYRSDRAGDCPICGMRLVTDDGSHGAESPAASSPSVDAPGSVRVSAQTQQLVGIRTVAVEKAPLPYHLRVPARVAVDEQRQHRIIAAVDGWIRKLGPNPAGTFVKKDQILASYYTPNLISATQTYVFALQTNAQAQSGDATIGYQRGTTVLSLQVALDSMRSLGISERQIREIERTRVAPTLIHVYSPSDGFVIARGVSPDQRFDKGLEMYRIADIGHVWVMADIFEKDRRFLKPGASATVRYQDRELPARMSDALPQFDPQSRTLKTRFELANPGYVLRPDMFVDVQLHVDMPAAVTVPADAVVDSGRQRTVYVERGEGVFEPRPVETGWRLADRVQVTKGLEPGDRVVVAGNFLIDSESRMKASALSSAPAGAPAGEKSEVEKDPVCGMAVEPKGPNAISAEHGGKTWYFCSEHCKKAFKENPERFAPAKKTSSQDARRTRGPA